MTPYTSWDQVPLVLRIADLARVLNVSTSTIRRELSRGTFRPLPLPRRGQTSPIVWAKEAVMREWGGLAVPPVGRRPFARGAAALSACRRPYRASPGRSHDRAIEEKEQRSMSIIACDQPDPQEPRPDTRQRHRDQGAFHLYHYLRTPGDPAWYELSSAQRTRLRAAFLIGAASIDLRRLLQEGR
jgi:hypothetical protein